MPGSAWETRLWSADQRSLREGLAVSLPRLNADHADDERHSRFPEHRWRELARTGLLGLPVAEQWGGRGQDLLTTMYVLEGLGEGCRDGGLAFSAVTHMVSTGIALQRFGSDALKEAHLPALCAGEAIGAHAITEPASGSDALAMTCRAERQGDAFVLNGSKAFVSNGPVADLVVVYARTDATAGPLGITAFLVQRETPGLTFGPSLEKMGLRTSPFGEVHLADCVVPATQVVGRVGGGFLVLNHVMKWEVLCSFIVNVGQMRHRLDRCLDYAQTRTAFGQPLGSFQAVSHRIVDMEIRLRTARSWLYDTATRLLAGVDVTVDVAISKLLASESNLDSALAAVHLFGGNGYSSSYGLESGVRDAVGGTIYSGTSEVQRNRIASMLGLR